MSRVIATTVAALTFAVSTLTAAAAVAEQAPAPAPAEPPKATPLQVRPSKPLELAQEPTGSRLGTTLAVVAAAAAGGVWLYRRRQGQSPGRPVPRRTITISARKAIGVRSELLVVDVDGQGMLLGVTPGTIQRLAVLPDPDGELQEADSEPEAEPGYRAMPPSPPPSRPRERERDRDRDRDRERERDRMREQVRAYERDLERERDSEPEPAPEPAAEPRRPLMLAAIERRPRSRKDLPLEEQVRGLMRGRGVS